MELAEPSGRPLSETHPHLKEFTAFLPVLNKESDRGKVLITASYLDELLRQVLLAFFADQTAGTKLVDGFNAPLGSLATRCEAASALGLVSTEERAEIDRIRKIRNRFAHDIHVSFDDQELKEICGRLEYRAKDYGEVVSGAGAQFTTAATCLILNLVNRPHYVAQKRLKFTEWTT